MVSKHLVFLERLKSSLNKTAPCVESEAFGNSAILRLGKPPDSVGKELTWCASNWVSLGTGSFPYGHGLFKSQIAPVNIPIQPLK